ncbi:MAG: hypothetical protein A2Y38_25245 [Spirochaetes bacterium GWB1_59_5]|nr:MAG: hypothetical protein A2Y38_25245 [Spirochaetes bacterium GWB1_59_5]
MDLQGKVMDLSKCGGVCRGACKHYVIGIECPTEATYEPREVQKTTLVGVKEWMTITEGKGGIARRDLMEWLIAEVDRLTQLCEEQGAERDKLALDGLRALAGAVCTPVEGYAKAGMNWLVNDIKALRKQWEAAESALSQARNEVERLTEQVGDLESQNENLQIDHDVMYARIRDANGQYTPEEVSNLIDAEIALSQAREDVERLTKENYELNDIVSANYIMNRGQRGLEDIIRLRKRAEAAEQREKGLRDAVEVIAQVLDATQELNMSNFDIDDVAQLNNSHIETYQIVHAVLAAASAQTICECQGYHSGSCTCDEGAAASEVGNGKA